MYLQDDGAVSGLADDQLAGVAVAWETSFRGEQGSWILLIIEEVARLEQSGFFIFSQRRLWRAQEDLTAAPSSCIMGVLNVDWKG